VKLDEAVPPGRVLSRREWAVGLGIVAGATVVAAVVPDRAAVRVGLAVLLAVLLGYVCVRSPREGLRAVLVWLVFLGLTRRLVSEFQADPGRDAFLLVAPFASGLLCARALLDGAWRGRSWLAVGVGALSVVAIVTVPNPRQGDLFVGLAGLLTWLAPMLWFWIGRRYLDQRLAARVVSAMGLLCVVAAGYGLFQFVVGFPAWDRLWIRRHGYAALYIGPTTVRPFGFSPSASEFALVAAFGCLWALLVVARALRRRDAVVAMLGSVGATVAGAALVLSAVRTALGFFVVALFVVYLVGRRGSPWVPLAVAGGLMVMVVALAQPINVDALPRDGATASVRRIVAFLQDPLGNNYEVTTDQHLGIIRSGIEDGFRHPFGSGPGATNLGAEQFGASSRGRNREFDLANAGTAFGALGILLVIGTTIAVLAVAIRRARARRDLAHLAALGLIVVSFGTWWNGGHYFLAALLWLLVGWLDAPSRAVASDPPR